MPSSLVSTLASSDAAPGRRHSTAMLLSCAVHLAAMFIAALAIRNQLPIVEIEKERPVAIVLVSPDDETKRRTYLIEPTTKASENASNSESHTDSAEIASGLLAAGESFSAALPASLPATNESLLDFGAGNAGPRTGKPSVLPGLDHAAILAMEAERRKGIVPLGPLGQVSLFGSVAAPGRSFVFIIDRSKSMGGEGLGAIDAAERELARALGELEERHTFQVAAYNQSPEYFHERRLLPATEENRRRCSKFLHELVAFGATEHTLAILSALRLKPDVLFVLTDGGDPYLSGSQLARIRHAAGKTSIHAIQFGWTKPHDEESRRCLERLAEQNGGSYRFVDMSER